MVLRVIPTQDPRRSTNCYLPPVLEKICDEQRGLVLVTGTTGSGKSTTLAAMIDHINSTPRPNTSSPSKTPSNSCIATRSSIVNQREVEVDTPSFAHALRSALRQDPDVILVGEMRDLETIDTALLAAETGHLVFSTLHTLDATETINRIIAVFPPPEQKQIRLQLAAVLKAVISPAPGAARRRQRPRAGRRSDDHHRLHPRLHHGQGKDAPDPRRHRRRHFAVRHADLRPVALRPVPAGPDHATRRRCAGPSNADEFKLKVQGISTTSDMAREEMARAAAVGQREGGVPSVTRFGR